MGAEMDNRTWTPDGGWEWPEKEWARAIRQRNQARRVARALYAVYLQVKDIDFDATEEYAAYEAVSHARRVLEEETKRAP